MCFNSVTLVGSLEADPMQRQVRASGATFTVLSVATQRSWKNTEDDWASKTEWHHVSLFRPRLAEYVLENVRKGAHILVEGSLVGSSYAPANGKENGATKLTSWSIRAEAVRKRDRGESESAEASSEPSGSYCG